MKIRVLVAIATLIIMGSIDAYSGVIAKYYIDNAIAVYYFNAKTTFFVMDYSGNKVLGDLHGNARCVPGKYDKSLSMNAKSDFFLAWGDETSLRVSNKFSIVAWVKIPKQLDEFNIYMVAYNPIFDNFDVVDHDIVGYIALSIKSDGNLFGLLFDYEDESFVDIETTGQNVNDNRWHHIGFVINPWRTYLYLDGQQIANKSISGYTSFSSDSTSVLIGDGAIGSVDNTGFFNDDFRKRDIESIYEIGLEKFMSVAPVAPMNKVTTTWGMIKSY